MGEGGKEFAAMVITMIIGLIVLVVTCEIYPCWRLNADRESMRFYNDENYYYCMVRTSGRHGKLYAGAIKKEDYEKIQSGEYGLVKIHRLGSEYYYSINSTNIANITIYQKDDWLPSDFY